MGVSARPTILPWEGAEYPPRQWQADALPVIVDGLKRRESGIVSAIMGSGKSILQAEIVRLAMRQIGGRAIVCCVPTEALVLQIADTMSTRVGAARVGVYYGRKKQPQKPVIVTCNPSLPSLHVDLAGQRRKVALAIVDEAHRSEAAQVRDTIPALDPVCLVGFTATPFRSVPTETVSLFDRVFYRYTLDDAITDGVLVPPQVIRWPGLEQPPPDEACLAMMRQHARGPGIVSAMTIADAEAYAGWLTERGWEARAIHSQIPAGQRPELIRQLREGEIRCLVHVSLLAEGVDLPWLRWLCLRRPVQARVRFLQEIGRALRVLHPVTHAADIERFGVKSGAVILDPHLLLGRHGWDTVEAIGQALQAAADAEAAEDAGARSPWEAREEEIVALDLLLAYLRRARADLLRAGVCEDRGIRAGGWQLAPVSARQVEAILGASRLTRHIPGECRDPLKALAKVPWALTRGEASDLLDVLFGGARWARVEAGRLGLSEPWRLQWSAGDLRVGGEVPDAESVDAIKRFGRRLERAETKRAKEAT